MNFKKNVQDTKKGTMMSIECRSMFLQDDGAEPGRVQLMILIIEKM